MIKNQRKSYDIIVLEDSSQAVFGGGQKVTVAVCEILSEFHAILIVDYAENSDFLNPFFCEIFADPNGVGGASWRD